MTQRATVLTIFMEPVPPSIIQVPSNQRSKYRICESLYLLTVIIVPYILDVKAHISDFIKKGRSMVSQTADYALRAVVSLGYQADTPQTTQQLAETTRVPAGYLSKVLQALVR